MNFEELRQSRMGLQPPAMGASPMDLVGGGGGAPMAAPPPQASPMQQMVAQAQPQLAQPPSIDDAMTQYFTQAVPGLTPKDMELGKSIVNSQLRVNQMKQMGKVGVKMNAGYLNHLKKVDTARNHLEAGFRTFKELEGKLIEGKDPQTGQPYYNEQGIRMKEKLAHLKSQLQVAEQAKQNAYQKMKAAGFNPDEDIDEMDFRMIMAQGLGLDNPMEAVIDDEEEVVDAGTSGPMLMGGFGQ